MSSGDSRRPSDRAPQRRPGTPGSTHHRWLQNARISNPSVNLPRHRLGEPFSGLELDDSLLDPFSLLTDSPPADDAPRWSDPHPVDPLPPDSPTEEPIHRATLLGVVKPPPVERRLKVRDLLERGRGLVRRERPIEVPHEIGDLLLGLLPPPVIAVTSRKGGVGKTAVAAALAQVLGLSISSTAGSAAIVDQNIGNADQWGRLDVAENAYTVRDLMTALEAGWPLPAAPTWASTPALAVYPESREAGDGYAAGLIQRFAQHMRDRHVATVVDLPNRLPSFTSAEAAVCAGWIACADLVLLPTTDDPNALTAVQEYLDVPSLRGKPVIVPYVASSLRDIREDPAVRQTLDAIRHRVAAVVTIPRSERATLAIVRGEPIIAIDPGLRRAYIEMTLVATRTIVAARRRGGEGVEPGS